MPSKRKKIESKKSQKRGEGRTRKPENSDQKTARLASKRVFRQNLQGQMGQQIIRKRAFITTTAICQSVRAPDQILDKFTLSVWMGKRSRLP